MRLLSWILFLETILATVIGIDFGTDWLKVSIIRPGGSIETVLNRESKRKTNAVLNLRNGIRTYGVEAEALGMRFPKDTYITLKNLLGKQYDDKSVKEFRSRFTNDMLKTNRSTVAFKHGTDTFILEELVAQLLNHCRKQAENYAGVMVSGAVITIPPHFTQFERQALLDAAEIANLKVFGLIHDETAVAINFALGKKFPEKEYHLFYDMGAGTTIATLASFQSSPEKKFPKKNIVTIDILATAGNEIGGKLIDTSLQKFLASEFMKQFPVKTNIFDEPRAMMRLLKEANRCKTILSANQHVTASVESLLEGYDFKLKVTREQLESLNMEALSQVTNPITEVLLQSNMTQSNLTSLVLFGGGVRVPAIQKTLTNFMGGKVARNVDGDEAAVLGAVLHAASVSAQFRLGVQFKLRDLNWGIIEISHKTERGKTVNTPLFTEKSYLGTKKLMTFNRTSDFAFDVNIKGGTVSPLAKVSVSGIYDAFKKYKNETNDGKVKITLEVNDSGMFSIKDANIFFTNISQLEEKKPISDKHPLQLKIDWVTIPPLSSTEKVQMQQRLIKMDMQDKDRADRESARNSLETYIYKCKELTWDDDVLEYATSEEIEKIRDNASSLSDWLEDHMEESTQEFVLRKKELESIASGVFEKRQLFLNPPPPESPANHTLNDTIVQQNQTLNGTSLELNETEPVDTSPENSYEEGDHPEL